MTSRVAVQLALLSALGSVRPALAQTGTIAGTVYYSGPSPKAEQLRVTTDQEFCGETVASRQLEVQGRKVLYAVAYLDHVALQPSGASTVTISNRKCAFDPPVLVAVAGATLKIRNEDPLLHNVHVVYQRRTMANLALPWQGIELSNRRVLSRPGLVDVECDVHDWMHANIWVFGHPFFDVTDAGGTFRITGIPPGKYTLKVWHQKLGEQSREVVLGPGATVAADFTFSR